LLLQMVSLAVYISQLQPPSSALRMPLLRVRYGDHKITHFFGSPQGPLSSSFSGVCAGCAVFVPLAPVAAVVVAAPSPADFTPFSFVVAAVAGLVSWALPSSHAKLTLLTSS